MKQRSEQIEKACNAVLSRLRKLDKNTYHTGRLVNVNKEKAIIFIKQAAKDYGVKEETLLMILKR